MRQFAARFFLLIFPSFCSIGAFAQSPAPYVENTAHREESNTPRPVATPQQLFGVIALSTHSDLTKRLLEQAVDEYENALYRDSYQVARHAAEADPQSALAYAMASFSARRILPDPAALAKAKSLLPNAAPQEQLLARWMVNIQDRDMLAAIASMNDLLKAFPRDKHILYMTAEWLYIQQDDDRARTMLESALQIDPAFPAALNRLGYVYINSGTPDPAKAILSLKHYAQVEPSSPNPHDSLAEILRDTGDDAGALEHYATALKLDPKFINSQEGLGGTRVLMGDYSKARAEYDRAIHIADNPSDELDAKCQKALVYFWEGNATIGRLTLATLAEEAAHKKEPNGQFEVLFARAMVAPDAGDELSKLAEISEFLEKPLHGMNESDRDINRALVLRERVRVASLSGLLQKAQDSLNQLESLASASRDTVVMNAFESARGYLLVQKGDLAGAADSLAADAHSPLALQRLVAVQEKLGNKDAAELTRTRLKYQRGPSVEWFLVTHVDSASAK
jgi:tetratricopeptide (TPR) repeat protein